MNEEKHDYAAFLLRLWRSKQDGHTAWRASLESTQTGKRVNFANLQALLVYLDAQFDQRDPPEPGPTTEHR